MKRFLLSLSLLGAVLFGHTQQRDLWFNELVPWPGGIQDEYIELYNTSISEIPLDCYVIVSVNPNGAYVYNFPQNAKLSGLSYYLISSSYDVDFKSKDKEGKTRYTFTSTDPHASNWNEIGTGGSILFYSYNSNTKKWGTGTSVSNNFNDFINDKQVSLLLYKINSDGTTSLVNGFFSKEIPASVTSLPQLDIAPGSCATQLTVPLIFNNGKITEQSTEVGPASGNQQGYSKIGNGICGNWVKTQNDLEFTPAKPNPSTIGTTAAGTLKTSQKLVCGNQIDFTVSAPLTSTVYPVKVLLFIDNNKDGVLDGTDTYVATYPTSISSGTSTVYSFTSLPTISANQQFLVVYQTFQGCYDQAKVPDVTTGTLNTTEKNICGNQVDYTITGTSADYTNTSIFPIVVEMYLISDGSLIATSTPINSFSPEIKTLEVPELYKGQPVKIVYNSSLNCLDKPVTPLAATGSYTTTENTICGNEVAFSLISATGDAITYSNFSSPVNVQIYYDTDNSGNISEADATQFTSPQEIIYSNDVHRYFIAEDNRNKKTFIVYSSASGCFNKTVELVNVSNATIQTSRATINCGSEVKVAITGATGEASAYVLPIQIQLYYDANANGTLETDETTLLDEETSIGYSADEYTLSIPLAYKDKRVILLYKSAASCVKPTAEPIDLGCSTLPVTYKSFTATRNGNKVALVWETAMEENNRGFHVQRNIDGSWKDIAFVFTQAEGGNSNAVLRYSYNDINTSKGISQYRILQVDMDGTGKYSEIRAVKGEDQASKVLVFPNPSHTGSVNVLFEDASSVRDVIVSDVAGRVVKHYKAVSSNSLVIENLVNGYYTVQIINHTTAATTVEKVIIKKR